MSDYREAHHHLTNRLELLEQRLDLANQLLEENNPEGFAALRGEIDEHSQNYNLLRLPNIDDNIRCVISEVTTRGYHPTDTFSVKDDQLLRTRSYAEFRLVAAWIGH